MMKEQADVHFDPSELFSYRKAMAIEEMNRKFYLDKAATAGEEAAKQRSLRLAGEEEKHLRIMENTVEFVA